MARSSRLVLPGAAHWVQLRGHDGTSVVRDDADGAYLLETLRLLAERREAEIHGWRVHADEVRLILRPHHADGLARAVQWLGRRYVESFNRRHGRTGTLWDGRFRAAVLQPGEGVVFALRLLDQPPGPGHLFDSSVTRLGDGQLPWVTQPPEYWALGNTPFERQRAWRALLDEPLAAATLDRLNAAVRSGRVFGDAAYVEALSRQAGRPLHLRRPGRPRRPSS